ncbi:cytochrome P450 [Nocardia sp. NPDC049220]|uniref:cytochrome P450 n=1 Tax=Nocardia sp. NPDC049220 TaxID=3155273 RepID=UPI0033C09FDF
MAFPAGGRTPLVGVYRRLRAIITDPVGLVERSAATHGDLFTLRIPFAFDLTYVLGADAYRAVMSLPAEQATIGPVFGNVPTVGFWFPRSSRDTDSLQNLVLAGRRLMAQLMTSARMAELADAIPEIVTQRTHGWSDRVDLSTDIHPIIYEASCRSLLGERVWADIGEQLIPLYRTIADGIDIPRATLAKTPLQILMPEYRATKALYRVLRGAQRRHTDANSPLLAAVAKARVDNTVRSDADAVWMLMYVLWNATAYPGSYTYWTLIDILQRPPLLAELRAQPKLSERQAFLSRCLQETIRLNPVTSLVRSLTVPLHIDHDGRRYHVPAGGYVGVFPGALNRDPGLVRSPDDYRPDRHAGGESTQLALFGRGAFGCVAREFSKILTAVTLDGVLSRYELDLLEAPPARRCRVHLTYPSVPTPARVSRMSPVLKAS